MTTAGFRLGSGRRFDAWLAAVMRDGAAASADRDAPEPALALLDRAIDEAVKNHGPDRVRAALADALAARGIDLSTPISPDFHGGA